MIPNFVLATFSVLFSTSCEDVKTSYAGGGCCSDGSASVGMESNTVARRATQDYDPKYMNVFGKTLDLPDGITNLILAFDKEWSSFHFHVLENDAYSGGNNYKFKAGTTLSDILANHTMSIRNHGFGPGGLNSEDGSVPLTVVERTSQSVKLKPGYIAWGGTYLIEDHGPITYYPETDTVQYPYPALIRNDSYWWIDNGITPPSEWSTIPEGKNDYGKSFSIGVFHRITVETEP